MALDGRSFDLHFLFCCVFLTFFSPSSCLLTPFPLYASSSSCCCISHVLLLPFLPNRLLCFLRAHDVIHTCTHTLLNLRHKASGVTMPWIKDKQKTDYANNNRYITFNNNSAARPNCKSVWHVKQNMQNRCNEWIQKGGAEKRSLQGPFSSSTCDEESFSRDFTISITHFLFFDLIFRILVNQHDHDDACNVFPAISRCSSSDLLCVPFCLCVDLMSAAATAWLLFDLQHCLTVSHPLF